MTSKNCRRCAAAFSPACPNQQYCSSECSSAARSERGKIYRLKNHKSRVYEENTLPTGSPEVKQKSLTRHTKFNSAENSIQEACNRAEGGKLTIIDIAKNLPETLSNWDLFVSAYYSQVGTVIKFVKVDDSHWSILKETEREVWTVGKWSQWFESTREKEEKIEAYYLVDIPVLAIHVQKLRENPLIDAFSYGGKFCMTQYIKKFSEDIPTPDLKYKGFIAPPWGKIMTFPHKDGFGTQLSVHCCIIGSGYNLIHCWPTLNPSQDMIFRQVTNLPPLGAKQKVPHNVDFTVDDNDEVWDTELEEQLIEQGISSYSVQIAPGQAIILPPDQYHCFKKIFKDPPSKGTPLVGLACDSTYVGPTEESFNRHYQSIKAIQRAHHWPNHIFCILELALYCLFQSLLALPSMKNDALFSAHIRAAYPHFVSWVRHQLKEAKLVMELIECTEDDIVTVEDYEEELFCSICKFPLVNIFVSATGSNDENNLCIDCLFKPRKKDDNPKKKISTRRQEYDAYQMKCRFASPKALEHLLIHVQGILGTGAEEITRPGKKSRDRMDSNSPVKAAHDDIELIQVLDDSTEQLQKELNEDVDPTMIQKTNSASVRSKESLHKPLKVYSKTDSIVYDSEEARRAFSSIGISISGNKRKSTSEESNAEPVKKKHKVDATLRSQLAPRLSDQIINDYLARRKNTSSNFNATFIFSTYYYEQFEDGSRSASWSSPNLFDYRLLVIPIFDRQREHWRLAILTNPQRLLISKNEATNTTSGLFVFDSFYDTSIIAFEIKEVVLRILWKHLVNHKSDADSSTLADKNLIVYPMQTCRQSNNIDCGVFMLHFIDEFVGFQGSDEEQHSRAAWKDPLDVESKRREISNALKASNEGVSAVATVAEPNASKEVSEKENSLFDEKNPRFKFNVYPPDKEDMTSLQTPKGLISAPILDRYLSFVLNYDNSRILVIPAHYSDMIASCDEEIITEFPNLISSKFILLPVHRNKHWVLVIITDVACVLQSDRENKASCNVFLLDSYHEYRLEANFFFDLVRNLLKAAVNIHTKKDYFNAQKIVTSSLPVVQQTNGYDCGLFLLHNVETFVKAPFSTVEQFSENQLWRKSFKPKVKRKQLFDKIASTLEVK